MQLTIASRNTDLTLAIQDHVRDRLTAALDQHAERVQRVTVLLEDVNGPRGGFDQVCRVAVYLTNGQTLRLERRGLDLYANVRPTYHIDGVPSPVKEPEKMDMITFRENTEDVYAGIEWEAGTDEVQQAKEFVQEMGYGDKLHDGPIGIGVKPITEFGTKRLVREAIDYAIEEGRDSVTLVHKGNIMKFTEGAFMKWGYEVAAEHFGATPLDGGP